MHKLSILIFFVSVSCVNKGQTPVLPSKPPPITSSSTVAQPALGINLQKVRYWTSDWPFVDVFKHSSAFVATTGTLALDANGYPISLAPGQRATTNFPIRDGGSFVLLYDGVGTIVLDSALTVTPNLPGRILFSTTATTGPGKFAGLTIASTTVGNSVRNIRIVHTDAEGSYVTAPFYDGFVADLKNFSTVRYLEWSAIDEQPKDGVTTWGNRTLPTYQTQGRHPQGVAWEYIISLSNTTMTNPWICVPHGADDNYVTQLATLLRDTLDPRLTVYAEFSNEVWNGVYTQRAYALEQGAIVFPTVTDTNLQGLLWQAYRSSQVMDIFKNILGSRVYRIMGSQIGVTWAHNKLLNSALPGTLGTAKAHHDALAIAPYFWTNTTRDPSLISKIDGPGGLDFVMDHLSTIDLPNTISAMNTSITWAKAQGVPVVGYEAGQQEVAIAGDNVMYGVYLAANRDPRMGVLYGKLLDAWKANGVAVHTLNLLSYCWEPSRFGYWGLLEHQQQDHSKAVKWTETISWSNNNSRWW